MLVPVLLILVLMMTLSAALFETSFASAKIALDRKLSVYLDVGLTQGTTDYVQSVQQYVRTAAEGSRGVALMPIPAEFQATNLTPICGAITPSAMCSLRYMMTVTAPTTTANGTLSDPDSSNDLEQQFASEQKVATVLTVSIVSHAGELLATRTRYLTLRVYNSAPFATLTGVRDANTHAGLVSSAEGDTAGRNRAALDAQGATAYSDTTIHALQICQQSGLLPGDTNGRPVAHTPASEGLPWGNDNNGAWEVRCNVPSEDVSNPTTSNWNTGTANQTNWAK